MLVSRNTNTETAAQYLHLTAKPRAAELPTHHLLRRQKSIYPGLAEFDGTDGSPSRGEGTQLRWAMGTVRSCRVWVSPRALGLQVMGGYCSCNAQRYIQPYWDTPLSDNHVSSATQVCMAYSSQEWWLFGGICISASSYLWLEARAEYESRAGVSPAPFWKITPFSLAGYQNVFPSVCCSFLPCMSRN